MTSKKPKASIDKTFRLIDFNVCDSSIESIDGQQKMYNQIMASNYENKNNKRVVANGPKQFIIQMFGLNEMGETCSIAITDYKPFFFVKVGDKWTQDTANQFRDHLAQKLGAKGRDILTATLVQRQKLYGFTNFKQFNFVQFEFRTQDAMNALKNEWYVKTESINTDARYTSARRLSTFVYKGTRTELYESGIPPILRYFHIQNISPSGWVRVKTNAAKRVVEECYKTTTCTYEYICGLSAIEPLNEKETRVPYKICSFDIEASSSHGDFPVPVKTYKRLATNMVDVFIRQFQSQKLDAAMSKKLIQKIIMAAFGFGQFDDVDLVYPKHQPSKPDMEYLLLRFVSTSLKDAHMLDETGDAAEKLSIMNAFTKALGEEPVFDGPADNESDDDEYDTGNTYRHQQQQQVNRSNTVVDVLCSSVYPRDQKIVILDEMLTSCFPALKGDEVTFIGSTFMRYGESEPYLNHCVVAGTCDAVSGCDIETANTERDVLLKWTEVIQRENPDIIIGYNIFGFDYEFMFRRAMELGCAEQFLCLSRRKNEMCAKPVFARKIHTDDEDAESASSDGESNKPKLEIEHTTVQLASGEYDLKYPGIPGRLQIDMYAYFRRDFNLSSYKLDDVAGQFIGDDIKRIEYVECDNASWLFSSNLMGLHVGDFIHIEMTGFTSDYVMDGHKFRVERIITGHEVEEMDKKKGVMVMAKHNVIVVSGEVHVDAGKSLKWGMAKDDVTPQDIFRLSKGTAADRAIVAKYCIQDCNLVHHLMNKIDVITGYVEMSRICSVPISFLVFRGQGIKLTSFVAKKCREKNTLMPDLDKSGSNEGYEGAIVLPPKCSMYMDNPVACVDYSSLYPSSMISNNLSHDSKVWTKEYDLDGRIVKETGERDPATGKYVYDELPEFEYIDIEFDTFRYIRKTPTSRAEKVKSGKMVCRWAQFEGDKKGIMPTILEELLKARSDTRKMAKTEKDPFMQNILDKRQLGYKVTANSLYGQCGAKTSTFYEKDVAASTTATGRSMITYARRIIEEVYGHRQYETENNGVVLTKAEYVYGDTDSVFFTFNLEDPATGEKIRGKKALEITIEIAQDAAHLCSKFLKPPMDLAYEKTLMPFVLLSKKRYVGMLYETDPNKGKLKYMGLSLKRRDSCDYLKDTYGGILNVIMSSPVSQDGQAQNNITKAIEFLDKSITQLIDGAVPMDKLAITKALRSDYKNPQQIAHKVLADRIGKRDPGNKPKPGDRIKFVHVVHSDKNALQGEKIETPEFIIGNKLKIDYTFYITNQLMKPLQQLLGLALEQIWESMGNKQMTIRSFKREMDALHKEFPDLEVFMKKREKECSKRIKALVFDKHLTRINNDRTGLRDIRSIFGKKHA